MSHKEIIVKYIITPLGHLSFWVMVYFFYAYFLGYGSTNIAYVNKFSAFLMPATIVISYFLIYYLIPKYLLIKKYKLFLLYGFYTVVLSMSSIVLSILYGLTYTESLKSQNSSPLTKTLPFIVLGVFFVVLFVVMISLLLYNYRSIVTNENLKNKILQTQLKLKEQELKFLKMQIHPHFLFNSLNTIYGYTLKKADDAPEMILKLSRLLDYILYQVDKPTVLLNDELNHLEDYVSLEKMRFHDTLHVTVDKSISDSNVQIAPMLLIPFVENSFKHGSIIDGILTVKISIKSTKDALEFEIINSSITTKQPDMGIGLTNIKKRLNMLYSDVYTLHIEQQNNNFKVLLRITDLTQIQHVTIN